MNINNSFAALFIYKVEAMDNGRFYVFGEDRHGNRYDTGRDFDGYLSALHFSLKQYEDNIKSDWKDMK